MNRVTMVASQYKGHHYGDWTAPATIEAAMDQAGQGDPIITLHLRDTLYGTAATPKRENRFTELLRLSVDDARELVTVLNHMIGEAQG